MNVIEAGVRSIYSLYYYSPLIGNFGSQKITGVLTFTLIPSSLFVFTIGRFFGWIIWFNAAISQNFQRSKHFFSRYLGVAAAIEVQSSGTAGKFRPGRRRLFDPKRFCPADAGPTEFAPRVG